MLTTMSLVHAGFHANGCYRVLNDEIRSKLAKNRLILLFLPQIHGVRTLPLHPQDTPMHIQGESKDGCKLKC